MTAERALAAVEALVFYAREHLMGTMVTDAVHALPVLRAALAPGGTAEEEVAKLVRFADESDRSADVWIVRVFGHALHSAGEREYLEIKAKLTAALLAAEARGEARGRGAGREEDLATLSALYNEDGQKCMAYRSAKEHESARRAEDRMLAYARAEDAIRALRPEASSGP